MIDNVYLVFGILAAFVCGSIVGSFLNVVVWRLPRGEALSGRSHCAHCRHKLAPADLIPLLSYLAIGRRCRYCGQPISFRYFIIEFITAILFVFAWLQIIPVTGFDYLVLARVLFAISVLIAIFVIDYEHYLILNKIIWPVAAVVLIFNFALDFFSHSSRLFADTTTARGLAGALAAGLFFFAIWLLSRGRWMGFGDVKLSLFLGLVLGFPIVGVAVLLAFFIGAIVSLYLLASGRAGLRSRVPFGAFLAPAAVISLFYGQRLLDWYLGYIRFPH